MGHPGLAVQAIALARTWVYGIPPFALNAGTKDGALGAYFT